jgi:hypothetical protein
MDNIVKLELVSDRDPVEELEDIEEEIVKQIADQKILIKNENKNLRRLEKLVLEHHPTKPNDIAASQDRIKNFTEKLIELEFDLKNLKRSADVENEEKISAALRRVEKSWIEQQSTTAYIITDQQFLYIADFSENPEKSNVQLRTFEPPKFIEFLANKLRLKSWHLPIPRVKDLFNTQGKTYQLSRFSIDPGLWQQGEVYLPIQHMEQFFINRVELTEQQWADTEAAMPFFDALMYSLSGGREENQQHIERWILHKIKNYRRAVTTPDIIIIGHVGGNGKGILQAIIRLMLPAMLSGKANSKTLNGNFNAIMLGKIIVFFDDQNSKEIPLDVVKQLAGSETMIFEPKGKDQYEGEKTHSSAWFAQKMPFRLTPAGSEGGVDRRFSIMATNITFLESLRKYYQELDGTEITVEQSKDLAEAVVSNYLLNRLCIARWFKLLEQRHPEVDNNYTLKPLHGSDYQYFLAEQSNSYDQIWKELIQPVIQAGGCVPMFVIKEILRHLENKIIGEKTIVSRLNKLAVENKIEIDFERCYINIEPAVVEKAKQCSIIRPKDIKNFTNKTFDWTSVCNIPYVVPAKGIDLIAEDNFIFGVKNAVDDEPDTSPFNFESTDRNFNPGWEEQ